MTFQEAIESSEQVSTRHPADGNRPRVPTTTIGLAGSYSGEPLCASRERVRRSLDRVSLDGQTRVLG